MYLHIGQHKTGSTSIQIFLTKNRDLLYDYNFLYPDILGLENSHYFSWFFSFGHKKILDSEFQVVDKIIDDIIDKSMKEQKDIILSSEILTSNSTEEKLQKIKSRFNNFHIKILCYLRRQDEYAESFYNQIIKNGRTLSFADYIRSNNFDWNIMLADYESIFGSENLFIFPYDLNKLNDFDIFDHFLNVLGIDNSRDFIKLKKRENESYPNDILLLLRLLNSYNTNSSIFKNQLNPFIDFFDHYIDSDPLIFRNYSLFSFEERVNFLAKYINSNQLLSKKYLKIDSNFFSEIENSYKDRFHIEKIDDEKILFLIFEVLRRQFMEISKLNFEINSLKDKLF